MSVKIFIVICLFIYVCVVSGFNAGDYCSITCPNGYPHTACMRKNENCQPSASCHEVLRAGLTDQERQIILDLHNKYRMDVAHGHILGVDVPQAANMRQMRYNQEMEYIAQCHVNACNGMSHDKCRRTRSHDSVGQNLAVKSTTGQMGNFSESDISGIHSWANEVKDTPQHIVDKFSQTSGKMTGHYTQMVWADADEIGCGRIVYNDNGWTTAYIACNYAVGNIITQKIYERGPPCSRCPEGTHCSKQYPGLCDGVAVTKPKKHKAVIQFRDHEGWQKFFDTLFGRQRTI